MQRQSSLYGCEYRAFALQDDKVIGVNISDVDIVVNCAGPYSRTAKPLMIASMKHRAHYLDLSAELDSYLTANSLSEKAQKQNVVLLPGVGGSAAIIGCLADYAAQDLAKPIEIKAALHVSGSMSRGSAITASENLRPKLLKRINDELVEVANPINHSFDFGNFEAECFPITLPDLVTLHSHLGIANVETYVHASGAAFPSEDFDTMPAGPTLEERESNRYQASVQVRDEHGKQAQAYIDTLNGYSFLPTATSLAVMKIVDGDWKAGVRTTAELWGYEFALQIPSTSIKSITK